MFAEIFGIDSVVVIAIIVVVIGASRLPKIARSIGQSKGEFEKGLKEGSLHNDAELDSKDQPK